MEEISNQEELKRINQEIEAELERGMVDEDEEVADETSNRHVNILMVIAIVFALAIAFNMIMLLIRVVRLFF